MTKWRLIWMVPYLARALAAVLHKYADKLDRGYREDRAAARDLEDYADDVEDAINRERATSYMTADERAAYHALTCGPSVCVHDDSTKGYHIEHRPSICSYAQAEAIIFGPPAWREAALVYAETANLEEAVARADSLCNKSAGPVTEGGAEVHDGG